MSGEANRLTKERKITAGTYSNNKANVIRVYRKLTGEDYVIWEKMIDLKKCLCHRSLCYVAMKKITVFCGTKHPTKEQVGKYKKKKRVNGLMMINVCIVVRILLIKWFVTWIKAW